MNRRHFTKSVGLSAAIGPIIASMRSYRGPSDELIIGHNDHTYKVHANWAQLDASVTPLLNCHEMVQDKQGRLIMIGDHTQNNIIIFDRSGKVLDYWGTRFPCGHGLTLNDEGGEEFLYISDCGNYTDRKGRWQGQSGGVYKTNLDGNVIFSIGHPQTMGIYKPGQSWNPTETAVAPNGDIYVADGYGSNFIIRYNQNGEYISHFGGTENDDPNYSLDQAHGIAIDDRDKNNIRLIVTSRNEQAFKYFTLDGKYIKTVSLPGAYVCRPVIHGQYLYAGVCFADTPDGQKRQLQNGYITILDEDDRVISNPGGTSPSYINNKLSTMYQDERVHGIFAHGHDVCVDSDENLYLCQWNANRTPPIKLERV